MYGEVGMESEQQKEARSKRRGRTWLSGFFLLYRFVIWTLSPLCFTIYSNKIYTGSDNGVAALAAPPQSTTSPRSITSPYAACNIASSSDSRLFASKFTFRKGGKPMDIHVEGCARIAA